MTTSLGNFYHPKKVRLFNTTIKFHNLLHVAFAVRFLHPALSWCYGGESLLKHCKRFIFNSFFAYPKLICLPDTKLQTHFNNLEYQRKYLKLILELISSKYSGILEIFLNIVKS